MTPPRRTGPRGLELIRRFEGFSPSPYPCPAGYPTIGYGHRIVPGETFERIDRYGAEELLVRDLGRVEAAIDRLLPVPLGQDRFDALASFTYNLGPAALQRSTLRQRILRGDHAGAADEFSRWVHAGGRRLPGLVARRRVEAALYR